MPQVKHKISPNSNPISQSTTFTSTIRLREKGQITLPVKILKQVGIKAGDLFTIQIDNIPPQSESNTKVSSSKVSISMVKDNDFYAEFREMIRQKPGLGYTEEEEAEDTRLEVLAEERGY